MDWCFETSRSYNNIGPGPSFIDEIQHMSQQILIYGKDFFPGACCACGAMPAVTGTPVLCCAGCQLVSYCNKNCQRADWKVHKFLCKKLPVKMGKNIIVRKTESVRTDLESFYNAMDKLRHSIFESASMMEYFVGVKNIIENPRVCSICCEARKEMLFNCRCCSVSYCSECHRLMDTEHLDKECHVLYGCAMANWYLIKHGQLQIPDGLLNEGNLTDGLNLNKVSKLSKYSNENWLEAIVHLINERLTYPLTIHHALKNLKLGEQRKGLSEITSLTIHICNHKPMLDPRIWEFMLHQLPNLKILNLTFVNRHLKLNTPYNTNLPVERCSDCKRKQKIINYNIQPIHYHEYFSSDDYVEPDVVAVFGTSILQKTGEEMTGKDLDKAERFTAHGNMSYSKHTVVILIDIEKHLLKTVKSFHDARPVKVLLPVQENPIARFSLLRYNSNIICVYRYLCCLQRNH